MHHGVIELSLRPETPVVLKVALLGLLGLLGFLYALTPNLIGYTNKLANIPFQRYAWQTEEYISNSIFRLSSLLSITLVYTAYIFTHLFSKKLTLFNSDSFNFLIIWLALILLTVIKFILNKYYFRVHDAISVGNYTIDFHYSVNQLFSFVITALLLLDVFYFGLSSTLDIIIIVVIFALFISKLFGTILLLQNNFSYPLLGVFIYLCTFEIVPMLVIAKVLFANS